MYVEFALKEGTQCADFWTSDSWENPPGRQVIYDVQCAALGEGSKYDWIAHPDRDEAPKLFGAADVAVTRAHETDCFGRCKCVTSCAAPARGRALELKKIHAKIVRQCNSWGVGSPIEEPQAEDVLKLNAACALHTGEDPGYTAPYLKCIMHHDIEITTEVKAAMGALWTDYVRTNQLVLHMLRLPSAGDADAEDSDDGDFELGGGAAPELCEKYGFSLPKLLPVVSAAMQKKPGAGSGTTPAHTVKDAYSAWLILSEAVKLQGVAFAEWVTTRTELDVLGTVGLVAAVGDPIKVPCAGSGPDKELSGWQKTLWLLKWADLVIASKALAKIANAGQPAKHDISGLTGETKAATSATSKLKAELAASKSEVEELRSEVKKYEEEKKELQSEIETLDKHGKMLHPLMLRAQTLVSTESIQSIGENHATAAAALFNNLFKEISETSSLAAVIKHRKTKGKKPKKVGPQHVKLMRDMALQALYFGNLDGMKDLEEEEEEEEQGGAAKKQKRHK